MKIFSVLLSLASLCSLAMAGGETHTSCSSVWGQVTPEDCTKYMAEVSNTGSESGHRLNCAILIKNYCPGGSYLETLAGTTVTVEVGYGGASATITVDQETARVILGDDGTSSTKRREGGVQAEYTEQTAFAQQAEYTEQPAFAKQAEYTEQPAFTQQAEYTEQPAVAPPSVDTPQPAAAPQPGVTPHAFGTLQLAGAPHAGETPQPAVAPQPGVTPHTFGTLQLAGAPHAGETAWTQPASVGTGPPGTY